MKFRFDKDTEKLVVQEASRIEYNQCKIWLDRFVKNYKYTPAFKFGSWNGKIEFFNNGSVNMGLWKELVKAMKEIGSNFEVVNKEEFPIDRKVTLESVKDFCDEFFKDHYLKNGDKFIPRDYQIDTAFKVLKNRYCLAEVATSGGKTLIMSIIIFYILLNINEDAKFLIIVPNISLVSQTTDSLIDFNTAFGKKNSMELNISIEEVMSDKPRKYGKDNPNIFIGCYQSLEKWDPDFFKQFTCVIVDESHQAKIKSIQVILENTFQSADYRFGLSGTFPSDDTAEILSIQSMMGPKISEISAKKLMDEGSISKVNIKVITLNHNNIELDNILKQIRKNPNRAIEAYQAEKEYVQKSAQRIKFIKTLIGKCTKNTLVLFNSIEFGSLLFKELVDEQKDKKFFYIDGEVKGSDRNLIKAEMELLDGIRILVSTYGTMSTGVSINNIHNVILVESYKSEIRIIQSIGRSLRLFEGKETANVFDIVDIFVELNPRNAYFKHGEERKEMYKKHKYPYQEMRFNL